VKSRRILLFLITVIFTLCVMLTFSRGGFVGLVAVGLYCWFRSPRKVASMVSLALLVAAMFYFAPEKYWTRIQTIQGEASGTTMGTGQGRIYTWKAGWRMFLDYPVFGVGPGNFNWHLEDYEPPGGLQGKYHGGRAAHSLYFTLLPELGTVGVILFALMLFSTFKDLRSIRHGVEKQFNRPSENERSTKIKYLTLALEGSVVAFLTSGAFISVLYYPCFWIWMAMVVALKQVESNLT